MNVNYGWRGKIGLIYMSSSVNMEPEFYAMSPQGVCTLTTRINLPKMSWQGLSDMANSKQLEECTQLLAQAKCDVILFGGTSASFLGGPEWEKNLLSRMKKMSGGITVINTSQSSVEALKAVKAKKIVIATPYIEEVTKSGVEYYIKQGFDVIKYEGLGYDDDHDIASVTLEEVYHLVRRVNSLEADAIFISCTNLKTIPIIDILERDMNKPVVTSNQASFWYALRRIGVNDFVDGAGSLFRLYI